MVDDDGLRDDDRLGGRGFQPGVDVEQQVRASSTAASTPLVPAGRSTAAAIVRVATSTTIVSSGRPGTPESNKTITSSGVESICTSSPGRVARAGVNGAGGRLASDRGVVAAPNEYGPPANTPISS